MKSIIIETVAGLGNRLVPLLSLYRLCKIHNIKLYVIWEKYKIDTKLGTIQDCNVDFNKIFSNENITLINSEKINNNTFPNMTICDFYKDYNNIDLSLLKKYDTLLIKNRYYLFGESHENISKWIPITKKEGIYKKDDLLIDLKKYIRDFEIDKSILNKVNILQQQFTKNMLGVHIRGSDESKYSFYRSNNKDSINNPNSDIAHFFEFCNNYLKKEDSCIFLMTPYQEIEDYMKEKYTNQIITYHKPNSNMVNNRSNEEGIKNGLIDLLLFSKCDTLIGTAGSSYSFLGWMFSNNNNYHIFF
tara:strand:+ start:1094 stop:1999 length:906 start_codon:yes stop_codon:yes gene_type:complete